MNLQDPMPEAPTLVPEAKSAEEGSETFQSRLGSVLEVLDPLSEGGRDTPGRPKENPKAPPTSKKQGRGGARKGTSRAPKT